MMARTCVICKESLLLTQEIQTVGDKGHSSLVSASRVRQDNLHHDLEYAEKPYKIHRNCFKYYSRQISLECWKRAKCSKTINEEDCVILRSQSHSVDIKNDCLYCGEKMFCDTKAPKSRRKEYSCAKTLPIIDNLISCALDRQGVSGMKYYIVLNLRVNWFQQKRSITMIVI